MTLPDPSLTWTLDAVDPAAEFRRRYPNGDLGDTPYRIPPPPAPVPQLVFDGAPPMQRLPHLEDGG